MKYFVGKIRRPFLAKYFLLRYYMSLLVTASEVWCMSQERLELRWGRTVDQKCSQCMGRLV
jgi:hypothetical protein